MRGKNRVFSRIRTNIEMTATTSFAKFNKFAFPVLLLYLLGGCAGPAGAIATVANVALEMSGLKKPELPDSQKPPRQVKIRLHAAPNLNADLKGNGMAVVVRLYKLRGTTALEQANYSAILDPKQEKEMLGQDLVESREIVLIPGQRYEIDEKVPYEAAYIGIVALFRAPAATRWKYAFQSTAAEKTGLTLGIHACALSVTAGSPLSVEGDSKLLSTSKCS